MSGNTCCVQEYFCRVCGENRDSIQFQMCILRRRNLIICRKLFHGQCQSQFSGLLRKNRKTVLLLYVVQCQLRLSEYCSRNQAQHQAHRNQPQSPFLPGAVEDVRKSRLHRILPRIEVSRQRTTVPAASLYDVQHHFAIRRTGVFIASRQHRFVTGQLHFHLTPERRQMYKGIAPMERPGKETDCLDPQISPSAVGYFVGQSSRQSIFREVDLRQNDSAAEQTECGRTVYIG